MPELIEFGSNTLFIINSFGEGEDIAEGEAYFVVDTSVDTVIRDPLLDNPEPSDANLIDHHFYSLGLGELHSTAQRYEGAAPGTPYSESAVDLEETLDLLSELTDSELAPSG